MQLTDPLTKLDDLTNEQYLLVVETSGMETPEEQETRHQDLRTAFGMALDRLATRWGEPQFLGGWDEENFPDWYDAVMMACWNRPEGTGYLAYQWAGADLPMTIAMGLHRA